MMHRRRQILSYICFLALVGVVLLSFPESTSKTLVAEVKQKAAPKDAFAGITLQAKAAYVYDVAQNKVLYAKNEQESLPLASLTKIMTAITASDLAPESTVITVSSDSLNQEGDSGLYGYEQWTLKDLLAFTLVSSSNDGAAAVATALGSLQNDTSTTASREQFVIKMNERANTLGLTQTKFLNETGLDISTTSSGAYGSARDTAKLLAFATMQAILIF
jgi:D-alanyl-D-alanine carboxypeptidase (penicillin-binding protein 5/6)